MLDKFFIGAIIVNTMNNDRSANNDEVLRYQRERFQGLMEEIVQCCEARTAYLSEKFEIPQAEVRCLLLFIGERYFTVKGISKKLDVAKSRVTKIVEGLTHKDLVESINDPKDGRVRLISLTRAGQKKVKEIEDLNDDLHQKLLLEFDPEERKAVLSSLELVRSSMEAIKEQML